MNWPANGQIRTIWGTFQLPRNWQYQLNVLVLTQEPVVLGAPLANTCNQQKLERSKWTRKTNNFFSLTSSLVVILPGKWQSDHISSTWCRPTKNTKTIHCLNNSTPCPEVAYDDVIESPHPFPCVCLPSRSISRLTPNATLPTQWKKLAAHHYLAAPDECSWKLTVNELAQLTS